ncbi:hypothetical protein CKA32_000475 [Geitlerinema sp. FC II]|nr:hypothetical protein CKA32_000475 [Geitlerinema sp. FC II]
MQFRDRKWRILSRVWSRSLDTLFLARLIPHERKLDRFARSMQVTTNRMRPL